MKLNSEVAPRNWIQYWLSTDLPRTQKNSTGSTSVGTGISISSSTDSEAINSGTTATVDVAILADVAV